METVVCQIHSESFPPIPNRTKIPTLSTPLATNTPSQLNIFRHNSHTLGVNSTKIGILEKSDEVGLGRFLKRQYGRSLEAKIALEILGYFAYEALEGD